MRGPETYNKPNQRAGFSIEPANDVLRVLQRRADKAMASGYDKPSACNGNSEKACASYAHFELFRRMVIDLQALELERVSYYLE